MFFGKENQTKKTFPQNKEEALKCAENLVDSIELRMLVCFVAFLMAMLLSAGGIIGWWWILISIFFTLGYPAWKMLELSILVSGYLTKDEVWEVVEKRLF